MWNERTIQRYNEKTEFLKSHVIEWIDSQANTPLQWEGPSLYFHKVLVKAADEIRDLEDRTNDLWYAERLYACLASWGIHRFDNPNARLVDFSTFREQLACVSASLSDLTGSRLEDLSEEDMRSVISRLGPEMDRIRIVVAYWPFVANSKLLHHLFPRLVPPLDRNYTLQYFIGRKNDDGNDPSYTFGRILWSFWKVATAKGQELADRVVDSWDLPTRWNTTIPKLIDNALVVGVLE